MQGKVAFLADDQCDQTAVGLIVRRLCDSLNIETVVIYAPVQRWFRERVHPVTWLTEDEIIKGAGNSNTALQLSIEHIRQLCVAPWEKIVEAVANGLTSFDGRWCSLCMFYKVGDVGDFTSPNYKGSVDCVLNSHCQGNCCGEWQAAHAAFVSGLQNSNPKVIAEFQTQILRLFGKLVLAQISEAEILIMISDCWEDLYKMRVSKYVSVVIEEGVYVCGVSLSKIERALMELPNFTVHAPGPDFSEGLLYDIDRVLKGVNNGEKETVNSSRDGGADNKSAT